MNVRERDKNIIVGTVDPKNAKRYLIPALTHLPRAINGLSDSLTWINQMDPHGTACARRTAPHRAGFSADIEG